MIKKTNKTILNILFKMLQLQSQNHNYAVVAIMIMSALLSSITSMAQMTLQGLRYDPDYVYGQGYGDTYSEADRAALSVLISKIAVGLSTEVIDITNVVTADGQVSTDNALKLVVNSYSNATLTNTHTIVAAEEPQFCIVRYISQDELGKIFHHRKEKVFDYIRNAQKAESKGKIDDALRYYYWGFLLLKSLQYPNSVRYDDNPTEPLLISWIPQQIDDILSKLDVKVINTENQGTEATLYFTYHNHPVNSLEFSYYNGNSWTPLTAVKDGVALIDLRPGVNPNTLRIKYEYEFMGESQIDPEIQSVIRVFKNPYFRKAEVSIGAKAGKGNGTNSIEALTDKDAAKAYASTPSAEKAISLLELDNAKGYDKIIRKVIESISSEAGSTKGNKGLRNSTISSSSSNNSLNNGIRPFFTDEGWDIYTRLLHYGKAKIIGTPSYSFYRLDNGRVVCRSIKMSFSFPNNHKTFTEDVTFTFDKDQKIESLAFGLGSEASKDIFDKGIGIWDEKSKLIIATFLENYKTAFALKRLDFIESIFDDNAVIIVGYVVRKVNNPSKDMPGSNLFTNETVIYNQYTKNQYVNRLRDLFKRNEFININFSDNEVVKMGKGGELYAIQIHQDYYSSIYGDTGYLFLLVDVNNPDEPIIKVRTWQPERDPNINGRLPRNHPDYGVYGPGLF